MRGSRYDCGLGDPRYGSIVRKLASTGLCTYLTVKNVKLLCILASDAGLKHVQAEYPDLEVGLEQGYVISWDVH